MLCERPTVCDYKSLNCRRTKLTSKDKLGTPLNNGTNGDTTRNCQNIINHPEQGSFLCGTVSAPWGSNSSHNNNKSEKKKCLSRLTRNDGALSRHKQWLKDMQEKRVQRLKEVEDTARLKMEKDKAFMERQARRRHKIRELEDDHDDTYKFNEKDDDGSRWQDSDKPIDLKGERSGDKRLRPAWSLTECDAENVKKINNIEDEENLLDFVNDLNFDQYFEDMEFRVLMTQLKDRIGNLEKEKKAGKSLLDTMLKSDESSISSDAKYSNNLNYFTALDEYEDTRQKDEIQTIAESIRNSCEASIGPIHSQKSMQMMVSKAHDRIQHSNDAMNRNLPIIAEWENTCGERNMNPPATITHSEDNGARLAGTKSLNKLPFKNRNPAL